MVLGPHGGEFHLRDPRCERKNLVKAQADHPLGLRPHDVHVTGSAI